ncbi:hypothetical protein HO173_012937 [Letharia columbiana]|uniref:Uncharacterized protein n=1 Tax=Letharia columbiana TaxID=112416 RepID=A0A8H6CJD5_9LECA|nr:uncharacterized protein HO173_012937 [Letharia columbiana]KAF6224594.1 hypothetical protein HO173_012937 [Letharia columbiana]
MGRPPFHITALLCPFESQKQRKSRTEFCDSPGNVRNRGLYVALSRRDSFLLFCPLRQQGAAQYLFYGPSEQRELVVYNQSHRVLPGRVMQRCSTLIIFHID